MTHHTDAEQLHQLLELVLTELDRKAIPIAYMQEIDRKGKAFIEQAARRAPAAPVPQGWIDPNDKAQKQYLPHIGERVLFKHDGRVYLGKHTGGSFKAEYPFGKTFGTWDCMWMYPSALDAAAPHPPEAAPVQLPEPQAEIEVRSMKTYLDLSIHEWRDTLPDGTYNIYTEQQVRQLLAQHGIK